MAGYFVLTPPKPRPNPMVAVQKSLGKTQREADKAKHDAFVAERDMKERTWGLSPEELGTRVMEAFTRLSERRNVQVASFGTGRAIVGAGLEQSPFTVIIEGAFSDVVAAMADLERPSSKLAISSVALTPKEVEGAPTGRVAATIMLTAFVREKEAK